MEHHYLKHLTTYLAGPIDRCPNLGSSWRDDCQKWLEEDFSVIVLNPRKKEEFLSFGYESDEFIKSRNAHKLAGNFKAVKDMMKPIRALDLRLVDKSDFLIVYLDMEIPTCGTYEELFWANRRKIPVLVTCKQGMTAIPDWLYGTLPLHHFFENMDDVKYYLQNVSIFGRKNSYSGDDYRWMFFEMAEKLKRSLNNI